MTRTIELHETRAPYNLNLDTQELTQGPIFIEQNGQVIAVILNINTYRQRERDDFDHWRQMQLQQLEPDRAAFYKLLPTLLQTHQGQFVAIHQQQMLDADRNRIALAERLNARGFPSIYIQKVTPTPRTIELDAPQEVWRA